MEEDLIVYSIGICHISVCTNLEDRKEIERKANMYHPVGLSDFIKWSIPIWPGKRIVIRKPCRWRISKEKTFSTGEPQPYPCNHDPETRTHYLLSC